MQPLTVSLPVPVAADGVLLPVAVAGCMVLLCAAIPPLVSPQQLSFAQTMVAWFDQPMHVFLPHFNFAHFFWSMHTHPCQPLIVFSYLLWNIDLRPVYSKLLSNKKRIPLGCK